MSNFRKDDDGRDVPDRRKAQSAFRSLPPRFPVEDEEFLCVEEETVQEVQAGPAEGSPAFPPKLARTIRRRAWADFANRLISANGSPQAEAGRPTHSVLRPWIEMAVCIGALVALNALAFPGDPGFRSLEFNPFLVPVLLMAVRYGTVLGCFTGLAAAVWLGVAARSFDLEDGSLILPGLLVAVGAAAGALTRRQGDRLAHYRSLTRELREERVLSRKALGARDAVIRDLQNRIEEHTVSVESLYQMSQGMSSGEPDQMYACLLDILAHDMGAERAAVYALEGDRLVLKSSLDRKMVALPFPPLLSPNVGLPGLALRLNRVVSIFDPEASGLDAKGEGAGLLSGLIHENGAPVAVVVVEALPLMEFTPASVSRLAGLLRWAGESVARAARLREARQSDLVDEESGTYKFSALESTLDREISRAHRYGTPLRMELVRILGFEKLPPEHRSRARQDLAGALCAHTRAIDTVCSTSRGDTFAVVLPMYRSTDPTLLDARIKALLAHMGSELPLHLSIRFSELNGHPTQPRELLAQVEALFP